MRNMFIIIAWHIDFCMLLFFVFKKKNRCSSGDLKKTSRKALKTWRHWDFELENRE